MGIIFLLIAAALTWQTDPVSADPTTVIAAPTIKDRSLRPGSTFSINITVSDVQLMFGYQFILNYDTSILSAIDYGFYSPFTLTAPSKINDTSGYVAIAASSYMGDPNGLTTFDPFPVARIYFIVDDRGSSVLDLSNTTIADIYGTWIPHNVVDGFFANIKTKVPNTIPESATPRQSTSSLPVSGRDAGELGKFYALVNLTETYNGRGTSGNVHVYENFQAYEGQNISFALVLYRYDGTYEEQLQVGFYKNIQNFLYAEWSWGTPKAAVEKPVFVYGWTQTLTDHLLEIVEVAPETFEARIDSHVVVTHTLTPVLVKRLIWAQAESDYTRNSLRGHFWNLKWADSGGVWHPWQQVQNFSQTPYSVFSVASDNFYTLGGGVWGDVNGDGGVDILDWSGLSAHWTGPPRGPLGYDSNFDIAGGVDQWGRPVYGAPNGAVEIDDLALLSAHWWQLA